MAELSPFDQITPRKNTDSLKFDFAVSRGMPADVLPLWVADMDFPCAPPILEALQSRVAHGVFGYTVFREDYTAALAGWWRERHGYEPRPEWVVTTPGVVFAICCAINAFTEPGDGILIQQPVYYPFSDSIANNGRRMVSNDLIYENGAYRVDYEDMEAKIIENQIKLFILCSPHNPVGRVWRRDELTRMGEICLRHGVTIVADEIHCDFVAEGHRHLVFAGLSPELANCTLTCTAPSKTFNLAGLQLSNIFIANPELRQKFIEARTRTGYDEPNCLGLTAAKAAYTHGAAWLEDLLAYLAGNVEYVRRFLAERLPQTRLIEPEGTYLLWLDCNACCRARGIDDQELDRLIINKGRLWLDSGSIFGSAGRGFQRFNAACPRATLADALERFARALA